MRTLINEVWKPQRISNSVKFSSSLGISPGCSGSENIRECGHGRKFSCNIRGGRKFRKFSSRRIGNIFATTVGLQRFYGALKILIFVFLHEKFPGTATLQLLSNGVLSSSFILDIRRKAEEENAGSGGRAVDLPQLVVEIRQGVFGWD